MHRVTHPRRGLAFGLAVVAVPLFAAESFGQQRVRNTTVNTGQGLHTATPVATTTAGMPISGSGASFQPSVGGSGNLGTFDIVINPSAALTANPAALAAFNRAAASWEAKISDPITVTIDADFSALGSGILGSTNSVILFSGFNSIRNQMVVDAADEGTDDLIVASLPTAATFIGTVPSGFSFDGNIQASKANFKALGFTGLDAMFGASDANIAFSTGFTFDFDKSDGISAGAIDFEGVAAHEIGHALGFFSAVDDVDFILPGTGAIEPTPLDLFRFLDNSANDPNTAADFATKARNFVPGAVDITDQVVAGSQGALEVLMSTGIDFGDGRQASHWKDNLGLGLMDPTAAFGENVLFTANDYRAMDLIGYDIVPEPTSAALLALVGMTAFARRSRRSRV